LDSMPEHPKSKGFVFADTRDPRAFHSERLIDLDRLGVPRHTRHLAFEWDWENISHAFGIALSHFQNLSPPPIRSGSQRTSRHIRTPRHTVCRLHGGGVLVYHMSVPFAGGDHRTPSWSTRCKPWVPYSNGRAGGVLGLVRVHSSSLERQKSPQLLQAPHEQAGAPR